MTIIHHRAYQGFLETLRERAVTEGVWEEEEASLLMLTEAFGE